MKTQLETNPLLNANGRYRVEFRDPASQTWQLHASTDVHGEAHLLLDTLDDMGYGVDTRIVDSGSGPDARLN
jgi:hypothetical protein